MSLKVVKFDPKMYLNFSNFRGRTSAGGSSLGPKTGTSVRWGGLATFSPDGGPPSPPQEKTLPVNRINVYICDALQQYREQVVQAYFEIWAIEVGIGAKSKSYVDLEIFFFFTYLCMFSITSMQFLTDLATFSHKKFCIFCSLSYPKL